MSRVAYSTPWGTIRLGPAFHHLPAREQQAVLAHERGHIVHRHAFKRLAWLVTLRAFFRTEAFFAECRRQELEADHYAAQQGHAAGLISFLFRRQLHVESPDYPSSRERVEALRVR